MIVYCVLCRAQISTDRERRGAVTCCAEHAKEYRRQKRAERAKRFCRLCGRPTRKSKIPMLTTLAEKSSLLGPVLKAHSEPAEPSREEYPA